MFFFDKDNEALGKLQSNVTGQTVNVKITFGHIRTGSRSNRPLSAGNLFDVTSKAK